MRRRDAFAALASACAGGWAAPARAQDASGRVTVPDARLLDSAGTTQRLRALCEPPVVIGFFYTGCSTVCPPQTAMPDASSSCRIASMEPPDFRSG